MPFKRFLVAVVTALKLVFTTTWEINQMKVTQFIFLSFLQNGIRRSQFWLIIFASMLIAGCGIGDSVDKITKKIDEVTDTVEDLANTTSDIAGDTVATIDDAIDALDRNSASWQTVLQDVTKQLTADTQSTIRNEISDLLNRSVAASGTELRCDLDFIGTRVRQALVRIRAHLLDEPETPVEPALCHVVPAAVDMALDASRRNKVEVFGYDFDTTPIKVKLYDKSRAVDVSKHLHVLTHYHMTLNLGGNGVPLTNASNRLTLEWNNDQISSIAVIQPATPVCKEKIESIAPSAGITFTPPHKAGDKDFIGFGPEIWANAEWIKEDKQVKFKLWMKALQTKSDPNIPFVKSKPKTKAEGTHIVSYYKAPSGWRIESIESDTKSSAHYVDTDHNEDRQGTGPNGPVKEFVFRGDRKGEDSGSYTGVDVRFNPLIIKLVQEENCAPASAVKFLQDRGQLSPATIKRLNPELMKLQLRKP